MGWNEWWFWVFIPKTKINFDINLTYFVKCAFSTPSPFCKYLIIHK
jgi:hypothetical protein